MPSGKKRKNAPSLQELLDRTICYYCDRDFSDDKTLIEHQRAKHFKCSHCNKRLNTAGGLGVHMSQVHKETLTEIENTRDDRKDPSVEIFGMVGFPQELLDKHNRIVTDQFYKLMSDHRAVTGNPPPGTKDHGAKKQKLEETSEERKQRLAEFKAKKRAEKAAKATAEKHKRMNTRNDDLDEGHYFINESEHSDSTPTPEPVEKPKETVEDASQYHLNAPEANQAPSIDYSQFTDTQNMSYPQAMYNAPSGVPPGPQYGHPGYMNAGPPGYSQPPSQYGHPGYINAGSPGYSQPPPQSSHPGYMNAGSPSFPQPLPEPQHGHLFYMTPDPGANRASPPASLPQPSSHNTLPPNPNLPSRGNWDPSAPSDADMKDMHAGRKPQPLPARPQAPGAAQPDAAHGLPTAAFNHAFNAGSPVYGQPTAGYNTSWNAGGPMYGQPAGAYSHPYNAGSPVYGTSGPPHGFAMPPQPTPYGPPSTQGHSNASFAMPAPAPVPAPAPAPTGQPTGNPGLSDAIDELMQEVIATTQQSSQAGIQAPKHNIDASANNVAPANAPAKAHGAPSNSILVYSDKTTSPEEKLARTNKYKKDHPMGLRT